MGNIIVPCCCPKQEGVQPDQLEGLKLFQYEIWFREQRRKGKFKEAEPDTGVLYYSSEIR